MRIKKLTRQASEFVRPDLEATLNPQPIDELVLKYTYRALKGFQWNKTKTAKALGVSIRTLRNYTQLMERGGVVIERFAGVKKTKSVD